MNERLLPISVLHPALAAAVLMASASVSAQSVGPTPSDPHINVLRTVNPRVAYRAIPKEDMPLRARATTFPSSEFDHRVRSTVTELGDELLGGQSGSGGIAPRINGVMADVPMTLSNAMPMAAGAVPLGLGARVGGGIGGATSQVAPTVTGALSNLGVQVQAAGR